MASLGALMVKNLPAMQETRIQSLGPEDPPEKEMATHCSILIHDFYCQRFGAKILTSCQCGKTQVENSKWCHICSITWCQGRSSLEECTSNQPLKEFPPIYYPRVELPRLRDTKIAYIDGGKLERVTDCIFLGFKIAGTVTAAMKLKDACSLEEKQ